MSSFDPELLLRLAAADANAPPPPGAPLSPARLQAHAARRRRERGLLAAAAVLLLGLPVALWPAPARATTGDAADAIDERHRADVDLLAELRALRDRLDGCQQDLRRQRADDDAAAVRTSQFQLTTVRADAVLAAGAPTKPHPEQPR